MSERITKLVLAVLAINSAAIGLWAAFALLVMSRQLVLQRRRHGSSTAYRTSCTTCGTSSRSAGSTRHRSRRASRSWSSARSSCSYRPRAFTPIHARRAVTTPSRGSTPRELQSALVGRVISGLGGIRG
jgi:hypothetical protein